MNHKFKVLRIGVIFIVSIFLLVLVVFSAHGQTPGDRLLNTQAVKQDRKTQTHDLGHGHISDNADEAHHNAADETHDETHENHDIAHDEHTDEDHDPMHSNPEGNRRHAEHAHEFDVEPTHDDHEHGEQDHDDEVLELTEAQKRQIGLSLEQAGPGTLFNELSLMGEIRLNEDRVAHVVPRVEGVVETVTASLGAQVQMGQTLATVISAELAESEADYIEKLRELEIAQKAFKRKKYLHAEKIASEAGRLEKEAEYLNAETALKTARRRLMVSGMTEAEIHSLQDSTEQFGLYVLRSPISGTVIEKHITMGEKLNDDSDVFTIADLSKLWVDLNISSRDMPFIKQGTSVVVQSSHATDAVSKIFMIGPVVDAETRTGLARLMLDNTDGRWMPGTFVTGQVRISSENLPVVVPIEAVQNIEGKNFIFVPEGHGFKPVPVEIGRRDRTRVEVVSGLKPHTSYVMKGAFELKAITVTRSLDSHAGHGH